MHIRLSAIEQSRKSIFAALITLTLLLSLVPIASSHFPGASITSGATATPPTIDGQHTAGEWASATTVPLPNGVLRVMHDVNNLYILIENNIDTGKGAWPFENGWVAIDTAHDDGGAPQPDDWLFNSQWSTWNNYFVGSGFGWVYGGAGGGYVGSMDWKPCPDNGANHGTHELQIPLSLIGVSLGSTVGLYVEAVDSNTNTAEEWPIGSGGNPVGWPPASDPCPTPSNWGDLTIPTILQPPVASFTEDTHTPMEGETVNFDASASSDADGWIVSYDWDFENDGIVDATGVTTSHTYPAAGVYTVNLTVTDNDGLTDTATDTKNVQAAVRLADLVRRSAWPEHHHYVKARDENAYQTLYGKVRNKGNVDLGTGSYKVVWDIESPKGNPIATYETVGTITLSPGDITDLTYDIDVVALGTGRYYAFARCWYDSDGDGSPDAAGAKIKSFSFDIASIA